MSTYSGNGHGNIVDGDSVHGFEFSYSCGFKLGVTTEGKAYPGKWVKPQSRLKLLSAVVGEQNRFMECELKTTVNEDAYVLRAGRAAPISQAEFKKYRSEELASRQPRNLADYALEVHLLQETSNSYPAAYSTSQYWRYQGTGRANLYVNNLPSAFDFTYDCAYRIFAGPGRSYRAKWLEPQKRLEVLAAPAGRPNSYYGCEFETVVKPDVYFVVMAGAINEVPREEFAKRRAAMQQATALGNMPVSKVSVNSLPDGGEIEVDGKFMGNAPSVLSLPVGEHRVVVRKPGYRTWERTLQLASGDITLNAQLEADVTK
jgi:hypothetical protein